MNAAMAKAYRAGARYRPVGTTLVGCCQQHEGLALSYLNFFDADAAWRVAHDLGNISDQAAVAIIEPRTRAVPQQEMI